MRVAMRPGTAIGDMWERAVVGGVLALVVHSISLYPSGGAEHQGLPAGGQVAVLMRITPRASC